MAAPCIRWRYSDDDDDKDGDDDDDDGDTVVLRLRTSGVRSGTGPEAYALE